MGQLCVSVNRDLTFGSSILAKDNKVCPIAEYLRSILMEISFVEKYGRTAGAWGGGPSVFQHTYRGWFFK